MTFFKWRSLGHWGKPAASVSSTSIDFQGEVIAPVNQVLRALVLVLYVLAGGYSLFLIWNHLNYIQVDLAGHMASGAWFKRGFFHQYQDANFLGYVHGLFYPPLEDLILTGFSLLSDPHPELGYKLYLSALAVGLLVSSFSLGGIFKASASQNVSRLLFLGILWISKGGSLYFQGLSFDDMHVTGLSSQILGGIFFFLFLREWMGEFRPKQGILFLTLCILSHIVVALVAVFIVFIDFVSNPNRRKSIPFILGATFVLSAFYLFPFIFYKSQLTSARIFGQNIFPVSLGIFLFAAALLPSASGMGRALLLSAALLHLPITIGNWSSSLGEKFPIFHYYRFAIFSLYLVVLGTVSELDSGTFLRWARYRKWVFISVVFLGVFLSHRHFSLFSPSRESWAFKPVDSYFDRMGPTRFPEYGRYWVIGDQRSADFGLDSLLQVHDPEFRSIKGLYWESSRNNLILSSYLATLLSAPVVLDHFYYWGYHCGIQKCLMDHLFRDYNVRGLMIESNQGLRYVPSERRDCYREVLNVGETNHYRLKKMGEFSVLGTNYSNYWLEPKNPPSMAMTNTNNAVEVIGFNSLVNFNRKFKGSLADYVRTAFSGCEKNGQLADAVFVDGEQLDSLRMEPGALDAEALVPSEFKGKLEFSRLSPGRFRIHIPGEKDVLMRIKLNYFPLLKLKRSDGRAVRLYDAFPNMLAVAHGDLILEFSRSWIMVLSYLVSLLGGALLFFFWEKVWTRVNSITRL